MAGPIASLSGAFEAWHPVTIDVEGPFRSEVAETFRDFRLAARFENERTGERATAPGFFAADGEAADTGARSGRVWRIRFTPPSDGPWRYEVSFRAGPDIAASPGAQGWAAGDAAASRADGATGRFRVGKSSRTDPDLRGAGPVLLGEAGFEFARSARSAEARWSDGWRALLGARAFDGASELDPNDETDPRNAIAAALRDGAGTAVGPDDRKPTIEGGLSWGGGRGRDVAAALRAVARDGANGVAFAPLMLRGGAIAPVATAVATASRPAAAEVEEPIVHPWTRWNGVGGLEAALGASAMSFDVSRLDQWERVLRRFNDVGVVVALSLEPLGPEAARSIWSAPTRALERRLFLRELTARFGHLNGLVWGAPSDPDDVAFLQAIDGQRRPVVSLDALRAVGALPDAAVDEAQRTVQPSPAFARGVAAALSRQAVAARAARLKAAEGASGSEPPIVLGRLVDEADEEDENATRDVGAPDEAPMREEEATGDPKPFAAEAARATDAKTGADSVEAAEAEVAEAKVAEAKVAEAKAADAPPSSERIDRAEAIGSAAAKAARDVIERDGPRGDRTASRFWSVATTVHRLSARGAGPADAPQIGVEREASEPIGDQEADRAALRAERAVDDGLEDAAARAQTDAVGSSKRRVDDAAPAETAQLSSDPSVEVVEAEEVDAPPRRRRGKFWARAFRSARGGGFGASEESAGAKRDERLDVEADDVDDAEIKDAAPSATPRATSVAADRLQAVAVDADAPSETAQPDATVELTDPARIDIRLFRMVDRDDADDPDVEEIDVREGLHADAFDGPEVWLALRLDGVDAGSAAAARLSLLDDVDAEIVPSIEMLVDGVAVAPDFFDFLRAARAAARGPSRLVVTLFDAADEAAAPLRRLSVAVLELGRSDETASPASEPVETSEFYARRGAIEAETPRDGGDRLDTPTSDPTTSDPTISAPSTSEPSTSEPTAPETPLSRTTLAQTGEIGLRIQSVSLVDASTDLVVSTLIDGLALDHEAFEDRDLTLRVILEGAEVSAVRRVRATLTLIVDDAPSAPVYVAEDSPFPSETEATAAFYRFGAPAGRVELTLEAFADGARLVLREALRIEAL